jgi:peptide/nickel transport system ATP-binding protein
MVDASLRMSIVNLFKKLRDELGVSVLYITHDLATAYYVSDRIAIMFRGDIVEMGTVEQVLMAPQASVHASCCATSIPQADTQTALDEGEITLSDTEQDEYLRQGCRFAGRCPDVMNICRTTPPPDFEVEGGARQLSPVRGDARGSMSAAQAADEFTDGFFLTIV